MSFDNNNYNSSTTEHFNNHTTKSTNSETSLEDSDDFITCCQHSCKCNSENDGCFCNVFCSECIPEAGDPELLAYLETEITDKPGVKQTDTPPSAASSTADRETITVDKVRLIVLYLHAKSHIDFGRILGELRQVAALPAGVGAQVQPCLGESRVTPGVRFVHTATVAASVVGRHGSPGSRG